MRMRGVFTLVRLDSFKPIDGVIALLAPFRLLELFNRQYERYMDQRHLGETKTRNDVIRCDHKKDGMLRNASFLFFAADLDLCVCVCVKETLQITLLFFLSLS